MWKEEESAGKSDIGKIYRLKEVKETNVTPRKLSKILPMYTVIAKGLPLSIGQTLLCTRCEVKIIEEA